MMIWGPSLSVWSVIVVNLKGFVVGVGLVAGVGVGWFSRVAIGTVLDGRVIIGTSVCGLAGGGVSVLSGMR